MGNNNGDADCAICDCLQRKRQLRKEEGVTARNEEVNNYDIFFFNIRRYAYMLKCVLSGSLGLKN